MAIWICIILAWILTGLVAYLTVRGCRRHRLELSALLLLVLIQIPPLTAWTLGATAEAAWQRHSLLSDSTVVDPGFERLYADLFLWVAVALMVMLALAPLIRKLLKKEPKPDVEHGPVLRVMAFGFELAALLVIAGPASLSDSAPYEPLANAVSPDGTREGQVVCVYPPRLPFGRHRETMVFLYRLRRQWFWKPVGRFEEEFDSADGVLGARCDWAEHPGRVRIWIATGLNVDSATWSCEANYDYISGQVVPVRSP